MKKHLDRRVGLFKKHLSTSIASLSLSPYSAGVGFIGLMVIAAPHPAKAFNLYNGELSGNNLEINLTTTASYSLFERVNNPSAVLEGPTNANGNDADSNFQHGIVGNIFQAEPILDIRDGRYGAHVSGEFYINTPYLGTNQNSQPGTFNPFSTVDNQHFTSATRNVNGENARLLDAFIYGNQQFDNGSQVTVKFGRQTLLWGQSLFFTNNGIAAGQAPLDIITAQDLPNPQANQVFLPTGQAVLTYRINQLVTLQGYYQFEYEHDNFQGVGAYFNSSDLLDKGGQRLILGPGEYLFRAKNNTPPIENGQFGVASFFTIDQGTYDVGLYGLRYDAKAPELYASFGAPTPTHNGLSVGNYNLVFPRDIWIYGTSLSTTVGAANVAGEVSGRYNMPLVSGLGISSAANPGNANSDPLYAVGDTLHAQVSELYVSPAVPGDPGGVGIDGEVEFNHLLHVTHARSALASGRQASAAAFDVSISPTYYNVIPSLTLTFPIGITYNFLGRSQIDASMQHGTGNFSVGIDATYRAVWIASVTYKDYLGKPDPTYNGDADRGYVALNIQRTF